MAPSTVFSYWRRDHRRSSASPVPSVVQPTAKGSVSNTPPQLPVIPNNTTTLPAFADPSAAAPGSSPPQAIDPAPDSKRAVTVSASPINAPAPSSANFAVSSAAVENHAQRDSRSEERDRDPALTSLSNHSQPSSAASRPHHGDGEIPRTSSPFRLSIGKNLLSSSHQPSDPQPKRYSTSSMPSSSHPFRFKTSPDGLPADKVATSQRDYKSDGGSHRRQGDRETMAGEHGHHKSGKTRLHLLNPMSLLARRRSHQVTSLRTVDATNSARNLVPAIPDDYDPRIRGNIVHDFSAPRARRNLSTPPVLLQDGYQHLNESIAPCADQALHSQHNEQGKRQTQYSPVFKEHFEDNQKVLQVENKAYLQSSLLTDPSLAGSASSALPVFARKLPSTIPEEDGPAQTSNEPVEGGEDTPDKSSTHPEPADVHDEDTIEMMPHQSLGLPKHLKSNASRFSFDMNGVESSAQEKLLEEKHKVKEAARRAKAQLEDPGFSDGEDFDADILDDMYDFEEKIPGVNVDADDEDDEFRGFSGTGQVLNKSWLAPDLSPVVASPLTPRIPEYDGAGDSTAAPVPEVTRSSSNEEPRVVVPEQGLSIQSLPTATESSVETPQLVQSAHPVAPQPIDDDDDLYFDDGEFGDLTTGGEKFDESVFDDETSHLYERKPVAPQPSQGGVQGTHLYEQKPVAPQPVPEDDDLYFDDGEFGDLTTQGETFDESIFDDETSHLYERKLVAPRSVSDPSIKVDDNEASSSLAVHEETQAEANGGLRHAPSIASEYQAGSSRMYSHTLGALTDLAPSKSHGGVLSEYNLGAFHDALAKVANDTSLHERFGRSVSISERSVGQTSTAQTMDTPSGLVSDDSHLSQAIDGMGFDEVLDDFDYDDNDAFLYDDPIIAAANAEALENDDDGFYGQEFGFYAQSLGACSTELTSGGYFGPRGAEGISRSFSSRGKFREPSLTPITERSEWSTRNSVISLTAHGAAHSNPALPSPGLAQLVDLAGSMDDEMSLSALMRLRRGAWGGSNGSLRSSSGSPPPYLHSSSNRASFVSDASPTVYTAPPDMFGTSGVAESPIERSEKLRWSQASTEQRVEPCMVGEENSSSV
ncbi:uncharacterized protein BO97DRAFT_402053 [Aspergillus homomorphus CBS 101889]|uniref:AGC-kinase C-terminal domain-containing protein n=1 Tax=Aspergillus homomorphus (strain CBS 101889) TaxID=1450537 RepID=A0A395IBT2_ASPHC|nr:hypothetical protein BO97DRAFT_402053 [Aspergillus homomorphus CBS 101889]RAL17491.1 hypothetical protein BO97DRAFT_402053 [Aspergillus homomorphus CBS 101889]